MGCGRSRILEQDVGSSLLGTVAASLDRQQLLQVSRKDLYQRLRQMEAAPSEGQGLGFAGLVDTVLLWNVMTRITDSDNQRRADALRAIRDEDISLVVLQRGLIVAGCKESEWRKLKKKEAAELLYRTLAASAHCDEYDSDSDHSNHCQLVEHVIEDDVADARMREWQQLCSESRLAKIEPLEEGEETTSNGSEAAVARGDACSARASQAEDTAAEAREHSSNEPATHFLLQDSRARDDKFEALDAELGACLGSHIEITIAELHSVSPCMGDSRKENQRKLKRRKVKQIAKK